MAVHNTYAQIFNETVQNIMICDSYSDADYITKCVYGNDAFAIDCTQYPCTIGCKYHDGWFWNILEDGTEQHIEYIPTQEQQVNLLTAELEDAQLALVEAHSENNQLSSEILTLQQAIVELYEKGGM